MHYFFGTGDEYKTGGWKLWQNIPRNKLAFSKCVINAQQQDTVAAAAAACNMHMDSLNATHATS